MSEIIWESETEKGAIKESHIVAIMRVNGKEHDYEMYDADCNAYCMSDKEFDSILEQINLHRFIVLDDKGMECYLNRSNFTDAICNDSISLINGWKVNPALVMELIETIKLDKEKRHAKKSVRKEAKELLKSSEGIDRLIAKEKAKFAKKMAKKMAKWEEAKEDFAINPEVVE